jgi:hypothetical protein
MRRQLIAVMAALTITLSGCTKDDPPPPDPTSAATTPANPDATLPPMPAVAQELTPNGAFSFVRHYVSVLSYASQTGDVAELRQLSAPDCGGCMDFVDLYEKTYADGGWIRESTWSMGEAELQFVRRRGRESFVTTDVTVAAGSAKRDDKAPVEAKSSSVTKMTFAVTFVDDWNISQLGVGGLQ